MEAELADLLNQTVTITAPSTKNFYGEASYGTGTDYAARVQPSSELIRDAEGKQIPARAMIYLPGNAVVTVESKITLPDGTTPPIIAVEKHTDDDGTVHHVKVVI